MLTVNLTQSFYNLTLHYNPSCPLANSNYTYYFYETFAIQYIALFTV
jgi:hypothetical protein